MRESFEQTICLSQACHLLHTQSNCGLHMWRPSFDFFSSVYSRLFYRISSLTILRSLFSGIKQCPRRSIFLSVFRMNKSHISLNTVLNDISFRCIIVWRCHFWQFLTKSVSNYKVIKCYLLCNIFWFYTAVVARL